MYLVFFGFCEFCLCGRLFRGYVAMDEFVFVSYFGFLDILS